MPCEVQKGQLGSAKRQGERAGTHHPGEGAKQRDSLRCREGQLWFASASSTKRTTTHGRKVAEHDVAARADGQIAARRFGKVDKGGSQLGHPLTMADAVQSPRRTRRKRRRTHAMQQMAEQNAVA